MSAQSDRLLIHSMPDGLLAVDLMLTIIGFNKALAQYTGLPSKEVEGHPLSELLTKNSLPDYLQEALEKTIQGKSETYLWHQKDGSAYRLFEIVCFPLQDTDGQIKGGAARFARLYLDKLSSKTYLQFQDVLEKMTDAFVALDSNWQYTYLNRKAAAIFNRTQEYLIGKHIWTEFPEGMGQPFYKAYYRAVAERVSITLEEYYPPYDRWFENRIYPLEDGLAIFFSDVTERKAREQELYIKSRALETSSAAILLHDQQGRVTYANPAFIHLYGYEDASRIIGNTIQSVLLSDHQYQEIQEAISKEGKWQGEVTTRHSDGWLLEVEGTLHQVLDEKGNFLATLSTILDITARKAFERELRLKSQAIASSTAGIVIANLKGEIQYVNPAFLKIAGLSSEQEAINKQAKEVGLDEEQYQRMMHELKNTGQWKGEFSWKFEDGSELWLRAAVSLIWDDTGKPVGRITSLLDITREKQDASMLAQFNKRLQSQNSDLQVQEEELKASNEELSRTLQALYASSDRLEETLKELNARNFELDQFVYKVSHDLRAPLTTIMGLVNLIKAETNPSVQTSYVELIQNRVQKLDGFIRSMLDYSKNTRMVTSYSMVDIGSLLQECWTELEHLKGYERIEASFNVIADQFYSDIFRLRIIFNNLLANAVKYQDYTSAHSWLQVKIRVNSNEARMIFSDNGIGISEEHQKRIFDMFYRATELSEGSGLGLYIVKQVIETLGGQITLVSKPGEGTQFTIVLPGVVKP